MQIREKARRHQGDSTSLDPSQDHAARHARMLSINNVHWTQPAVNSPNKTVPSSRRSTTPRPHLAEVTRVVLVHHDAVVVHATGVTATSWVLPVLANTTMAGTDVAPLLPVLLQVCAMGRACGHQRSGGGSSSRFAEQRSDPENCTGMSNKRDLLSQARLSDQTIGPSRLEDRAR